MYAQLLTLVLCLGSILLLAPADPAAAVTPLSPRCCTPCAHLLCLQMFLGSSTMFIVTADPAAAKAINHKLITRALGPHANAGRERQDVHVEEGLVGAT